MNWQFPGGAVAEAQLPDSYKFDRRQVDRWPLPGVATAFRLGGEQFGWMHELKGIDYSHDGIGAVCETVIEPGTPISIGFQAAGYPAKRGTVVRCLPCGEGYRLGVRFEHRMAA